eukprot:363506-Chlamydomonas_euryale.AAC.6
MVTCWLNEVVVVVAVRGLAGSSYRSGDIGTIARTVGQSAAGGRDAAAPPTATALRPSHQRWRRAGGRRQQPPSRGGRGRRRCESSRARAQHATRRRVPVLGRQPRARHSAHARQPRLVPGAQQLVGRAIAQHTHVRLGRHHLGGQPICRGRHQRHCRHRTTRAPPIRVDRHGRGRVAVARGGRHERGKRVRP